MRARIYLAIAMRVHCVKLPVHQAGSRYNWCLLGVRKSDLEKPGHWTVSELLRCTAYDTNLSALPSRSTCGSSLLPWISHLLVLTLLLHCEFFKWEGDIFFTFASGIWQVLTNYGPHTDWICPPGSTAPHHGLTYHPLVLGLLYQWISLPGSTHRIRF